MAKLTPKEQYSSVISDINTTLGDLLNPIRKDVKDFYKNHNQNDIHTIDPCGIFDRQPNYSSSDEVIGNINIDEVLQEIKNDPVKWGDLQEISPESFNVGSGRGNESGRTQIREAIYPKWLSEIDTQAKLFFRRGKTKEYYDEESLTRGVPRRKKVKKHVRIKSLFVLLDVSGSMWQGSYKGQPLIEMMIRYFPAIANQFEGELWQIDYGSPTLIIPLKQLRGSAIREMNLHGGGGTNYDAAFSLINDKKKMLTLQGKQSDFMTVLFTDGEVYWNVDVMPDNLLIVAPVIKQRLLPPDNPTRNWKSILIDIDNQVDEDE